MIGSRYLVMTNTFEFFAADTVGLDMDAIGLVSGVMGGDAMLIRDFHD